MEAKELRIGNWIAESGKPQQVTSIALAEPWYLGITHTPNSIGVTHGNNLEPIPLTVEHLRHNDFRSELRQFWKQGVCIIFDNGEFYFLNYQLWHDGSYIETKVEIRYFHQLQNLYFALTGNELTFK